MIPERDSRNVIKKGWSFFLGGCWLLIFISSAFLFENQTDGRYTSDLEPHIKIAVEGRGYSITSVMLRIAHQLGNNWGCAILLALLTVFTCFSAGLFLAQLRKLAGVRFEEKGNCKCQLMLIGTLTCFISSMYIPIIYPHLYWGALITQPWHNSSYLLMRLTGTITMMLFFRMEDTYLEKISLKGWLLFFLSLTLTNAAKPNFFVAFAPAMLIVLIRDFVKTRGQKLKLAIIFGLAVFCSMPVLFIQAGKLYNPQAKQVSGIAISTASLLIKISNKELNRFLLTSLLFPIMITTLCIRYGGISGPLKFAWLVFAVSFLESFFLVETGPRAEAGNLIWGRFFFGFILALVSFERYLFLMPKLKKAEKLSSGIIWGWNILSGVIYYALMCTGMSYKM